MAVLETKSAESSSSHEVYGVESSGRADKTITRSVFATTQDDHGVLNEDGEQRTHHKLARSQSPYSEHRFSTKEEPAEDPSYRQLKFVQELGWVINFKKSELTPTQKFDFLGYRFDLNKDEVSPTEKKCHILTTAIGGLNNSLTTTPRILMSF